jgi:DUF1680 family protein
LLNLWNLSIDLRYPAWANDGIYVQVNGLDQKLNVAPGRFFLIDREWNDGDTILFKVRLTLRHETLLGNQARLVLFVGPVLLAGTLGPIADPPWKISDTSRIWYPSISR